MSTIELNVTSSSNSGSLHVQLLIDGDDCGILYLSQNEYNKLNRVFAAGDTAGVCVYKDTEFDESV